MRRSIILSTVLAASIAVLGACSTPAPNTPPVKPAATVTPAPTSSPTPATTQTPAVSPTKPGTTPEVKKTDGKMTGKETKPAATETHKAN